VTKLLQCLRDELVRRDYAATTIRSYVQIVDAFRQHTGARLDRITPAQLRRYHLFLLEERRLAIGTVVTQICALRFFCRHVLNRRDVREDLPYPKERLRLPVVLSPDEVQRLIAHAKNLYHRTLLLTLYGAGLRSQRGVSAGGAGRLSPQMADWHHVKGDHERYECADE
jgi:integrase/recombinase XerD